MQEDDDSDVTSYKSNRGIIWIVARCVDEFKVSSDQFNEDPKLKSLIEELIDMIETEYFESALHDLLDISFHRHLKTFLSNSLTKPLPDSNPVPDTASEQVAVFPSPGDRVPLVKIVTQLYIVFQNGLINEEMKHFDLDSPET